MIDSEGNPTKEYIKFIREYKWDTMPIMDFVKIILDNWVHGDMGYKLSKKYKGQQKLVLHTLGWSGNEDVINEIVNNVYLTNGYMKFYQWRTGGHYYFTIMHTKLP